MNSILSVFYQYWPEWGPRLAEAAKVTAKLSSAGFAIALLLGAILVAMIRSGRPALRFAANFFIQFVRTVPLLALLLALYFALPPLGITLPGFWAGIIGLGLHGAAYVAEILRGGLQSIHRGQREAALAVGLAPHQVFMHVVFPQALRVMLPPLLNTYVALLKDSSLCALIATDELMLTARAMSSEFFLPLHIFLLVGAFYFAIAFPLSMVSRALEKHLSRGRRVMGST
ncbi:amino acid ABC transporter permease [Polaromonas sp. JS666]|uniref:amino acid ABC transporter permease n=1 Tax=Polaromonas sp. (strain JS666 / ATCC BAA-500) TaxID=296591 RepID=UPI0000465045|nr:amino acid ABC transporter permease [Polaromonas sp. JS666]ABE43337.1 amino acid ABC transporter membrane protein 2, PAAT family [Polaromonas sp. JS666]